MILCERIKASFAFDADRNLILFNSFDGNLYALDADTGLSAFSFKMQAGAYSTPLVFGNRVYISSLDKKLYCLDLDRKGELVWSFDAGARIFSSPVLVGSHIFIGANDGGFYEISSETGKLAGLFQTTERITNKAVYNATTKKFFVLTYANEIYCLSKRNTVN